MLDMSIEMQDHDVSASVEGTYLYTPLATLQIKIGSSDIHLSGHDEQFAAIRDALDEYLKRRGIGNA